MHIGIDGYEANIPERVGVGRFANEVLRNLYFLDNENKYEIFLPSKKENNLPIEKSNWKYRIFQTKGLWTYISLPLAIKLSGNKFDVFFSPTHYIPRFLNIPRVVSIMDLSYLYFPEMFRKKDLFKLKNWTAFSIKNSTKIITISHFTKKAIIDNYHISEDKIIVAYPGYDQSIFKSNLPENEVNRTLKRYKINNEYLLFVGTLQPRKNIINLVEAYHKVVKLLNDKYLRLVIVGRKGWIYEEIFKKVNELNLKRQIIFLDYIKDEDMPFLYSGAKALVLPSFYEGFGLPVIEAMACGTLTIVSNISSLPEIANDATIYINPQSTESLIDGINKILFMSEQNKNKFIQKGLENVKRFNWSDCARIILKTLNDASL